MPCKIKQGDIDIIFEQLSYGGFERGFGDDVAGGRAKQQLRRREVFGTVTPSERLMRVRTFSFHSVVYASFTDISMNS